MIIARFTYKGMNGALTLQFPLSAWEPFCRFYTRELATELCCRVDYWIVPNTQED
jgi:hypothetical protein